MKQQIVLIAQIFCKRLMILALGVVLSAILGTLPAHATGIKDLPNLASDRSTWVVDHAEVISRTNESQLNSALKQLAQETGNGVNLVAIRRLDYGETIDSFADKLFEAWFPTSEAKAHQTLLVLDTLTNNVAIRTGDAVNETMANDVAQSVAVDTVGVPLREDNKYNEAFLDAGDRLVAVLSGQPDPGPPEVKNTLNTEGTFTKAEDTDAGSATIWVIGLLIVATVVPMATYFFYVGFN